MITIRFSGRTPEPRNIEIGMENDQNAETLRFLLPQVAEGQSAWLLMILPDGAEPDAIRILDGMVTVPGSITEVPGRIRAWVEILGGDDIAWNSEIMTMDVGDLPAISEEVERSYPTAIQEALAAAALLEDAELNALRFDVDQIGSKTAAERARARGNIGITIEDDEDGIGIAIG